MKTCPWIILRCSDSSMDDKDSCLPLPPVVLILQLDSSMDDKDAAG